MLCDITGTLSCHDNERLEKERRRRETFCFHQTFERHERILRLISSNQLNSFSVYSFQQYSIIMNSSSSPFTNRIQLMFYSPFPFFNNLLFRRDFIDMFDVYFSSLKPSIRHFRQSTFAR